MEDQTKQNFRIDRISIRDYKGIDSLDLEFPRPKFKGDPDIFVIGSRNGLGKTSVLECCAWGLVSLFFMCGKNISFQKNDEKASDPLLPSLSQPSVVRIQSQKAITKFLFSNTQHNECETEVTFSDDSFTLASGEINLNLMEKSKRFFNGIPEFEEKYHIPSVLRYPTPYAINESNQIPIPSIDYFFLYFPDSRFLFKGTVPLKELQSDKKEMSWISEFKIQALEAILGKSGLLEGQDKKTSEERFDFLNDLVKTFAKCELSPQLKQGTDSSLDIRVRPKTSSNGSNTYSFDGLSSGQKEMISTLFLIWENTRNASKVILIDEPEQHLNAEWHRLFIYKLHEIAPWNQYIIATHSEHIMDAVDEERRILLVKEDKK